MKDIVELSNIKMLLLSLTGACNLACKYCYADGYNKNIMSFEIAKKAIDLVKSHNKEFIIQFSGGEPLLNIELIQQIINYVEQNDIKAKLQIQTNGTLFSDENIDILSKGKVAIGVSIDGNKDLHDQQRPFLDNSGSFKKVVSGLELLKNKKINIGITCVITKKNVNFLEKLVTLSYYWGNIKKIGFDLIRGQGRGENIAKPELDDLKNGLVKAFDLGRKFSNITGTKILFTQLCKVKQLQDKKIKVFSHCHAMNGEAIYVDVDGRIYACASFLGNKDYLIGDVNNGLDYYKQEQIKANIKKELIKCFKCKHLSYCGGACIARWVGCSNEGEKELECGLKITSIKWTEDN